MDFSELPINVLDMVKKDVFNYEQCSLKELSNLALVSKNTYRDVKPLIYSNNINFYTLTCKCKRQLQRNDTVYLCKPFSKNKEYTRDWRCYHCTISSKLNLGKGLGKGGRKLYSYGVIDIYEPSFRVCNVIVRKGEKFKFCSSTSCLHNCLP
jgi:hypothetical protein